MENNEFSKRVIISNIMKKLEEIFDKKNTDFILEYIHKHPTILEHVTQELKETPLMLACKYRMPELAMEMIRMGGSHPEKVSSKGETALMIACQTGLNEIAIALIESGKSNPGQINHINNNTALIIACENGMEDVAIALIQTGQSKPGYVGNNGFTALMTACYFQMEKVALAIIRTKEANVDNMNEDGKTAYILASENELTEVVQLIQKKDITFNVSKHDCFDILDASNVPIIEYFNKDPNNIVIVIFNKNEKKPQCIGLTRDYIKVDSDNILYECRQANSDAQHRNIITNVSYYNIKALFGFGDLTYLGSINLMIEMIEDPGNRLFFFKRSNKELKTTVNDDVFRNRYLATTISARHCQRGQGGIIYNLIYNVNIVSDEEEKEMAEMGKEDVMNIQHAMRNALRKKRKGRTYRRRLQHISTGNQDVGVGMEGFPRNVTMRRNRSDRRRNSRSDIEDLDVTLAATDIGLTNIENLDLVLEPESEMPLGPNVTMRNRRQAVTRLSRSQSLGSESENSQSSRNRNVTTRGRINRNRNRNVTTRRRINRNRTSTSI